MQEEIRSTRMKKGLWVPRKAYIKCPQVCTLLGSIDDRSRKLMLDCGIDNNYKLAPHNTNDLAYFSGFRLLFKQAAEKYASYKQVIKSRYSQRY